MSKDFVQIAKDVASGVGMLRQGAPDAMKAFGALSTAATATNAIDTKTKELMALAIGIAVHCDGCVAYHTKMAHQHGAPARKLLKRSHSPFTWEAAPRPCTAVMRFGRMINSVTLTEASKQPAWVNDREEAQ